MLVEQQTEYKTHRRRRESKKEATAGSKERLLFELAVSIDATLAAGRHFFPRETDVFMPRTNRKPRVHLLIC